MNAIEEIMEGVRKKKAVLHLGTQDDVYEGLRILVDAARDAISSEMEELERLNRLSRVGVSVGLLLILVGLVIWSGFNVSLGRLTGGVGVLTEVVPLFLFRRVDESRRALRSLMPDYRLLFAALALVSTKDGSERAKLIDALSEVSVDQVKLDSKSRG